MGSRTSAAEATNAFKQSMKPGNEKLRRMSRVLKWVAETDMQLWRQFAPGDLTISLVQKNEVRELKPAEIWGPLTVKVTAVDDYMDDMVKHLEENQLDATMLPIVAPLMGKRNIMGLVADRYESRGIDVSKWFPLHSERDAEHVAESENLGFENLVPDSPKDGEDHDVHLRVHRARRQALALLRDEAHPTTGQPMAEILNLYDAHILATEQLQEKEQGQVQQNLQNIPGAQQGAPRTSGEVSGDMMAGLEGSIQGG